jgi:hypothetical protein
MVNSNEARALRELIQQSYKDSLFHTSQTLCGHKDINERTHLPIVRALESSSRRKLICVPRGTFKSSICSVDYPIWLLQNNPNLRILLDSEIYGNSKNFLREIKGILKSERFINVWGDWETNVWNESEIVIKARTRTLKEASITVSGIGAQKTGQHYDVIIGDDYNSPGNSGTIEGRQNVISHYQYNQSILELDGTYVIVGTRYSEDDLIGWIIKNELGLKTLDHLKTIPKVKGVREIEPRGLLGV